MGTVVVAIEGHVVGWVLETNDAATFNRLLGSEVDFGAANRRGCFRRR